jgi:WD40 repeat protein
MRYQDWIKKVEFEDHYDDVNSTYFSSDDILLVSGSPDSYIYLQKFKTQKKY